MESESPEVALGTRIYNLNTKAIPTLSKRKTLLLVLEVFCVSLIIHAFNGYIVLPLAVKTFVNFPSITSSMLFTTNSTLLFTLAYLVLRIRFIPFSYVTKESVPTALAGLVAAWIVCFLNIVFFGTSNDLTTKIVSLEGGYFHLSYLSLVFWGPALEEFIYRGFIFELLRRSHGDVSGLLLSSLLFTLFHIIWGGPTYIPVFFFSVLFTFVYIRGGLITSIFVHSMVNVYLFQIWS